MSPLLKLRGPATSTVRTIFPGNFMTKLTKRQVKSMLAEVGNLCGRKQRPTEPVLDYVEFLVDDTMNMSTDKYDLLDALRV